MKTQILLTRDAFRESVFARDNNKCVFCEKKAVDAHHILERRLFEDGGYYTDNGASVCAEHHRDCESTVISVEEVRRAANIAHVVVPSHLYADQPYDKWGNPVLPNGRRLKGELFEDASVQKVLSTGNALQDFTNWVKYPRTYHLPWSDGVNSDDRIMQNLDVFVGKRVIITEKMDGESTSMYSDYIHARSVDGRSHPSRDWVKQFWSKICADIPEKWRICGENLYAKHSIHYTNLSTFFLGFSIWNQNNICLSWDETLDWFSLIGIEHVPVIYDGEFNEELVRKLWNPIGWARKEGYVMRLADEIEYGQFRNKIGKFVRKGHIQTVKHWMYGQAVEPNLLADRSELWKLNSE